MSSAEDHAATAWLCAALPRLRAGARDDDLVLAGIDEAAREVREDASAAQVCQDPGYERHRPRPSPVTCPCCPISASTRPAWRAATGARGNAAPAAPGPTGAAGNRGASCSRRR